jgi:hypothetical protein
MTVLAAPTRVHHDRDRLNAECKECAQALHLREGCDRDIALGAFFRHHPNSTLAVHRVKVPDGWQFHDPVPGPAQHPTTSQRQ